MNVLVLGGHGRLGKRLVPILQAHDHHVVAPTHDALDATDGFGVQEATRKIHVGGRPVDLVVCLVAYADVVGCDTIPAHARIGNEVTTKTVGDVCETLGIPWLWTSSDYVVAGGPTPAAAVHDVLSFGRLRLNGAGQYAETKANGERIALDRGATVARIAFCVPEDANGWGWVDGYNVASREWVERTAARLALLVPLAAVGYNAGRIVHVGPVAGIDDGVLGPWRTREQLVRQRFGDEHPSLRHVVRSPVERAARGGGNGPGDTRFADCDPRLALDPG